MTTDLSTEVASTEVDRLIRWWWTCWCGMHWGFRRHAVVYWACHGEVSIDDALSVLGICVTYPLDVIIFYRELAVELTLEYDLAKRIVAMTPERERSHISRFYAGNSVFAQGSGSIRPIHKLIDEVIVPAGFPKLRLTDDGADSRVPTSRMIFDGLRRADTIRAGKVPLTRGDAPMLLVSSECPKLLSAMPGLEYNPKEPEDVLPVGTLKDSVWAACCNTYRDYPSVVGHKPINVLRMEAVNRSTDPTQRVINFRKFNEEFESGQSRPRKR